MVAIANDNRALAIEALDKAISIHRASFGLDFERVALNGLSAMVRDDRTMQRVPVNCPKVSKYLKLAVKAAYAGDYVKVIEACRKVDSDGIVAGALSRMVRQLTDVRAIYAATLF